MASSASRGSRAPMVQGGAGRAVRHLLVGMFLLFLLLILVLPTSTAVAVAAAPGSGARRTGLSERFLPLRRAQGEHVVLADCRDQEGVFSSQVAYFPGALGATPQDTAPVVTPAGQTRVWTSATTKAFFSTTGANFSVTLGVPVDLGNFAGTAYNDWTNFTCWRRYQANLYNYGGYLCAMAYDCTHEEMPAANGTMPSQTPPDGAAPKATASGVDSASSTAAAAGSASAELSLGAIIGVSIGSVVALVLAAGLVAFVVIHRRRFKRQAEEIERKMAEADAAVAAAAGGGGYKRGPGSTATTPTLVRVIATGDKEGSELDRLSPPLSASTPGREAAPHVEMDGLWRGVEVPGQAIARELDGRYVVPELDARGMRTPRPGPSPLPMNSPVLGHAYVTGYSPVPPQSPGTGHSTAPGHSAVPRYSPVPGSSPFLGYVPVAGGDAGPRNPPAPEQSSTPGHSPMPGSSPPQQYASVPGGQAEPRPDPPASGQDDRPKDEPGPAHTHDAGPGHDR